MFDYCHALCVGLHVGLDVKYSICGKIPQTYVK